MVLLVAGSVVGATSGAAQTAAAGTFSITPTKGPAGTQVTVSSVTPCSSGGGSVEVILVYPVGPADVNLTPTASVTEPVGGDGSWDATFTVEHPPAGVLSVRADCSGGRQPEYANRRFTITSRGRGYWFVAWPPVPTYLSRSAATGRGDALHVLGAGAASASPVVGLTPNPRTGAGFWQGASDGGVFAYGDAAFHGSLGGMPLASPIVGIAAFPGGGGYWLVAADGGVFAFGNAPFHGSLGGRLLAAPIVGMAATPDGGGYWLVSADGGVFAFGNATFAGSAFGLTPGRIVGMAADRQGDGYWLAADDGAVFTFGRARFHGSTWGIAGRAAVVGIAGDTVGDGYWLAGADGGVFAYGHARYFGKGPAGSIGIVATPA